MTSQTGTQGPRRAGRMRDVLEQALRPTVLTIEDESARHAGHAGAMPGGETHYRITIVSESFSGLNRIERSRMLHRILDAEFSAGLHALSMDLRSPSEL